MSIPDITASITSGFSTTFTSLAPLVALILAIPLTFLVVRKVKGLVR